MTAIRQLAGLRFGKLLVLTLAPDRSAQDGARWLCQCDCGNFATVSGHNFGQDTNSCGCLRNTQGGLSGKHHLYRKWAGMIGRCTLENDTAYKYYGQRGIKVCERWRSFPNFLADMEATYFPGATLERKNNDGNYELSNCRWATTKDQNRNKRGNVFIEYRGERLTIAGWAERLELPRKAIEQRLRNGWPPDQALTTPLIPRSNRRAGRPTYPPASGG